MKKLRDLLPSADPAAAAVQPAAPQCPICGDLGWVSPDVPPNHPQFGKLIPCPHRAVEASRSQASKLWDALGALRHMTFETFKPEGHAVTTDQRASLRTALEVARGYSAEPRGWLYIQGSYGVGKTHLAAAIANACLSRGLPTLFVNVPDLLDYLREAYRPNSEESYETRLAAVRAAPLLILDDLGTQNATSWADEKLYQIINARYVAKLPTVVTSNLDVSRLDPRLSSRLADIDLVRQAPIHAPDYRRSELETSLSSISTLAWHHDQTFESFALRATDLSPEQVESLRQAVQIARAYAARPSGWLLITGNYGVGKTHLAAAIANYQAQHGNAVIFVVVPDLLDHLRAAFRPDAEISFDERFEEIRMTPLLVLDDLSTEATTPWAREKLYQLLNHRYTTRLATIFTSAVSPESLDARIRSRLLDGTRCTVLPLVVPSYGRPGTPLPSPATTARRRR